MTLNNDAEFRQRMRQVEGLIEHIEKLPDATARGLSRQLTQSLLDLHAAGLRKMLDLLPATDDSRSVVPARWLDDPLIANLLILHDLHPVDATNRVECALENIRPLLDQQGITVQSVEFVDGSMRIRVSGGCGACPSSTLTPRRLIDDAVCGTAPELTVEIEGLETHSINEPLLPILNQ